MTITGISSNVSVYSARYANSERRGASNLVSYDSLPKLDLSDSPAAVVEISESAMQMALHSLHSLEYKVDASPAIPQVNIPTDLFSPENIQRMQEDNIARINGMDGEEDLSRELRSEAADFSAVSPQKEQSTPAETASLNSSWIANQLAITLRRTAYNKSANVEQRAVNRESALSRAQYIADRYLDTGARERFISSVERIYTEEFFADKAV